MNTNTTTPSASTNRRIRYGSSTLIILLAVTVSCIIAGALATRWTARFDVTATREHSLAPRTLSLLASLDQPTEIVIVADFADFDPRAQMNMREVLDGFDAASQALSVTEIDLSAANGRDAFTSLLDRLATTIKPQITAHEATLRSAIAKTRDAATSLHTISQTILSERSRLSAASAEAENLSRIAAAARLLADSIDEAINDAVAALDAPIGGAGLPQVDAATVTVASTQKALLVDLNALDAALSSISFAVSSTGDADLGDAADALMALRDSIARSADTVDRLTSIQSLAAIRTIEAGAGAVVIAGDKARAVPMNVLFPPAALLNATSTGAADIRFIGESLLGAAIGSLSGVNAAPIVVLVHGAAENQLDGEGRPLTPDAQRAFGSLIESMRLRDIRIAEWAPATGTPRPTFTENNIDNPRPVVWVTFPVTIRSAAGAQRMGQHAAAIKGLLESGANVLFSFDASTLPSVGEPDPMAEPLAPLGITVQTGAAMLRRVNTPSGPVVDGQFILRSAETDHPIGRAINGLSTQLAWPCPIELTDTPGVTHEPILSIPESTTAWGEMEWIAFRSLSPAQRSMLADAPEPDEGIDLTQGPWPIAVASERPAPDEPSLIQRLIVVGANGWFTDVVTRNSATIDGRTVSATPGNAELFEASIAWLAHQDDTIAAGPGAFETARIPAISQGRLTALRWGIIAGMPLLVLLTGVLIRLGRG